MWIAAVGNSTEMFESIRKRARKIVVFAEIDDDRLQELQRIAEMVGSVVVEANEPSF